MPTRVILDTDIGTDVDDAVALALLLGTPELQVEGITCVYGDVLLRARMVLKLLQLCNRTDIPVMVGAWAPLLGLQPIYWAGHEGEGLLEPSDEMLQPASDDAVGFIVRTVMEHPGQIHLITIGPLTNAAHAFLREPRLAQNLAHLTIMGGVLRSPDMLHLPYSEHNIRCDPEAAHIVLSSGTSITLVPLDVTTRVRLKREGVERIRLGGSAFHEALAEQVERYPYFQEHDFTYMHDPLAVATVIQPDLVTRIPVHVDVELHGQHTTAATLMRAPAAGVPANIHVAVDVDVSRFEAFLVSQLEGSLGKTTH